MTNLLQSLTEWLRDSLGGQPPPPAVLADLGPRIEQLLQVSVDPGGAGVDRWLNQLRALTGDDRVRDTLVVRALQMSLPRIAESLTLLGIIEIEWDGPSDTAAPTAFRIRTDRLDDVLTHPGEEALRRLLATLQNVEDVKALQVLVLLLVTSPSSLLSLEYRRQGFAALPLGGTPGVTSDELVALVQGLVNSPVTLPLPLPDLFGKDELEALAGPPAPAGSTGSITIDGPETYDGLRGLAVDLLLKDVAAVTSKKVDLGGGWVLSFVPGDPDDHTDRHYRIGFVADGLDPALPRGDLALFVSKAPADADALLLGDPTDTHLSVRAVRGGLRLRPSGPLFDVVLALDGVEFVVRPGFLRYLGFGLDVPSELRFRSDLQVVYTQGHGLSGQHDGGVGVSLEFATPLDLRVGSAGAGLALDQVVTQAEATVWTGRLMFRVVFRYSAKARFGPLSAAMDGAGVWLGRWTDGTGGVLPPSGIGLDVSAGPVTGGGFLEVTRTDEYAGALQLKILGIGAFAFGLLTARPGDDPSVVLLIGIRLPLPGVQLGFGFAVSGFGGLVGVNRRADTDLLRERLVSGAAGDVLFNDDPAKNAPKLLGDMALLFPEEPGVFLVGPTLQLNWAYLITLDVGLFVELPGPRKIFLAGSARMVLGSEEFALVYLRMDFVGGVDLTKSLVFFDAALVNSHVLGIFRITGGVALRLAYGENGYFLFTVGGFHPSFHPGAMELPQVQRVGVSASLGPVWFKQQMYLAVTSNTFQLGSRTEAGIEIGPISAHGWFGFDALIQLKPFYFVAPIDAGFDVEVEDVSLCNVRVTGELSGPGPLVLKARARVRILLIKVSGNVTLDLSNNPPEPIVTIPDLPAYLSSELSDPDNLRMEGQDPAVVFAPQPGAGTHAGTHVGPLVSPVGQLVWEQKRVPLGVAIQKAEGITLEGGWHTLRVASGLGTLEGPEQDWFGVGTYLDLSDAEALNTSRFVRQQSGLRVGAHDVRRGAERAATIALHLVKLPTRKPVPITSQVYVGDALAGVLAERADGATLTPGDSAVHVSQETFVVRNPDGTVKNLGPINEVQAFANVKLDGGTSAAAAVPAVDLDAVL